MILSDNESIKAQLSDGYGSSTSSFPDLKRNNTQIEIKIGEDSKRIVYVVNIIEETGGIVPFATFNLEDAKKYCLKANKMIKKWAKYWDKKFYDLTDDTENTHIMKGLDVGNGNK